MNDYFVYIPRYRPIPPHPAAAPDAVTLYHVAFKRVRLIQAWTPEEALQKAKAAGFFAPMIGPAKEEPTP